MDKSTKVWLDNDYWRVYTGILGLSNYRNITAEIKADFRREQTVLVIKFRQRLEALNND